MWYAIKDFFIAIIEDYSGLGILILLFLEYVGFPIPGETLMSILGFMSAQEIGYSLYINIIFATTGTFLGYTFAYIIGYKYGEKFLLKYQKFFHVNEERLANLSKLFNKHKIILIIFSRYVLGVRHIVPYLCGISKLKLRVFMVYNLIGSLIWCSSFLGLGYFVGDNWDAAEKMIKTYSIILIVLIVFLYIVYKYFNKYSRLVIIISIPLVILIVIIQNLIEKELTVFDSRIYDFISIYISESITNLMVFISFLGSGLFLTLVASAILLTLWRHSSYSFYGKMIALNLIVSYILNILFKTLIKRERPDMQQLVEISGYSFPSGHSMVSLCFYGFIIFLCYTYMKNRWKYLIVFILTVLIIFIGISRVYLGVHYPSDVLAGFSTGLIWLAIYVAVIEKIRILYYQKKTFPDEEDAIK